MSNKFSLMNRCIHVVTFICVVLAGSAQNVGINTSDPKESLHIKGGGLLVEGNAIQALSSASPDSNLIGQTGILNDTSGYVFDSGGPLGGYGNNEDIATVADVYGDCQGLVIDVTFLSLQPGDTLYIESDPIMHKFSGTETGSFAVENCFVVIRFTSDASGTSDGFQVEWRTIFPTITDSIPVEGLGGRLMWVPGKYALRSGLAGELDWDPDSIGRYSTAVGYKTRASGSMSFASGEQSSASGNDGATALGSGASASGDLGSFAAGTNTRASGFNGATAFGVNSIASGNLGAIAMGLGAIAAGSSGAIAMGSYAKAMKAGSIAIGKRVQADGQHSVVIGADCRAIGLGGILIGEGIGFNNNLQNQISHSLSVGFLSDIPTFVVSSGDGTSGSLGKVGIGTSFPGSLLSNTRLEVAAGHIFLSNDFGVLMANSDSTGFGTGIDGSQDDDLFFFSGSQLRATLAATGKFGIGTAIPTESVTVENGSVHVRNLGGTNTNKGFLLGESSDLPAFGLVYDGVGSGVDNKVHMKEFVGGGEASVMTFTAGGRVGVNLEDPGAVNSDTYFEVGNGHIMVPNNYGVFSRNSGNSGLGAGFDTRSDDALLFFADGTNKASITAAGRAGIGTTSPATKLEVVGTSDAYARLTNTSSSSVRLEFKRSGSDWRVHNTSGILLFGQSSDDLSTVDDVLRLGGGSVTPAETNTISLGASSLKWTAVHATNGTIQTSDQTLKKNIQSIDQGLNVISQLRPVSYQWKEGAMDQGKVHLGFIAQDLQAVIPQVVYDHDWVEENDSDERVWVESEHLGVNYAEITPILVKAIQQQQLIIEELRERVRALEEK